MSLPPTEESAQAPCVSNIYVGQAPDLFPNPYFSEEAAEGDNQMCGLHEEAPRKVWPVDPDSEVLRVLQEAELQPLTQDLGNVSLCDEESSSPG